MDRAILKAFQRRSALSRGDLAVDTSTLRPVSAADHVDIAVPGFVGSNYAAGGICLLSVNPAGGKDSYHATVGDCRLYESACAFASVQLECAEAAMKELEQSFVAGMPWWGSQWRHVSAVMSASAVPLNAIAYVYLVPFRTRKDEGSRLPKDVVQKAVRRGFYDVLDALRPKLIVAMDKPSHNAGKDWAAKRGDAADLIYYTRKRDDHAGRSAALAMIENWADG